MIVVLHAFCRAIVDDMMIIAGVVDDRWIRVLMTTIDTVVLAVVFSTVITLVRCCSCLLLMMPRDAYCLPITVRFDVVVVVL
jgi:hypothetical protein